MQYQKSDLRGTNVEYGEIGEFGNQATVDTVVKISQDGGSFCVIAGANLDAENPTERVFSICAVNGSLISHNILI